MGLVQEVQECLSFLCRNLGFSWQEVATHSHKSIQTSCCGLEGTWVMKYELSNGGYEWTFCMWPLKRVLHCTNMHFQQEFGWLWLTNQIVLSLLNPFIVLNWLLASFLFLQIWKMKMSNYEMRISRWRITSIAFSSESLVPARKSWRSKVNLLQGGADLYWDLCRLTTSVCVCVCVAFSFVCSMSVEWWTGTLPSWGCLGMRLMCVFISCSNLS